MPPQLAGGLFIKPKRITLGEWLDDWLSGYVKTNCSSHTLDGYQPIVRRHLIPNLGIIPLAQVQPQHIQRCYGVLLETGLSGRTVLHIHRVLSQALNYAARQGLLVRNPAEFADPSRARKPKMNTLTPEEVARLFSMARDMPYYAIIYTAVKTGLRQAELLGLRWRDLDLDLASFSVTQVLYKRKGVCVFGNINGNPMDPGTLTHNFARIARRAGWHSLPRFETYLRQSNAHGWHPPQGSY